VRSRLEGETAILMRESGQPGALDMMLQSIRRWPWHEFSRYRVALHMTFKGYPLSEGPRAVPRPRTLPAPARAQVV
jgi:hypothetical protein